MPEETEKKGFRPGRWTIGILVGLGFLTLLILAVLRDEEPPDVSDLIEVRREVRDRDNAFLVLRPLSNVDVYWLDAFEEPESLDVDDYETWGQDLERTLAGMTQGRLWDEERARVILEKNAPWLEAWDRSFERPEFQLPVYKSLDDFGVEYIPGGAGGDALEVLKLRSWSYLREGDGRHAVEEAFRLLEFSRRVRNGQGFLIDLLISLMYQHAGFEHLCRLTTSENVPPELIRESLTRVVSFGTRKSELVATIRVEFVFSQHFVDMALESPELEMPGAGVLSRLLYRPHQTNRILAGFYRELIRHLEAEDYDALAATQPDLSSVSLTNYLGKMFIYSAMSFLETLATRIQNSRAHLRFTRVFLAARLHHRENDKWPEKLDDLVPRYLKAVPLDPYDGKPLRYRPDERIVYSVGEDGIDGGGKRPGPEDLGDDDGDIDVEPAPEDDSHFLWMDVADPLILLDPGGGVGDGDGGGSSGGDGNGD